MPLILLVEDNHDIAAMVGDHLEQEGHEVDYAADGVTGLHLAVSQAVTQDQVAIAATDLARFEREGGAGFVLPIKAQPVGRRGKFGDRHAG